MQQKERRIVAWSAEEDDVLREQIGVHGTENWAIIAANFKDKSTRQCRRRWYNYLNTDFKKGGWSQEEDLLLCEAQKIFGNRWTEIAKVVSGRTDNAVKNRFTTLCKKRARIEAMPKATDDLAYLNSNVCEFELSPSPLKKLRSAHVPEIYNDGDNGTVKIEGSFLKKDDPKILALMQQAELLGSLAMKVNIENRQQKLENSKEVVENFLGKRKDVYDSPSGSDYSNGSSVLSACGNDESEMCAFREDGNIELASGNEIRVSGIVSQGEMSAPDNEDSLSAVSLAEFSSPLQLTPLFTSFAATIPSPHFSESERHFLMKTLGIESPAPGKSNNPPQPPPCRRALVHSL